MALGPFSWPWQPIFPGFNMPPVITKPGVLRKWWHPENQPNIDMFAYNTDIFGGRSLRINPNGMSMHITNPQVQHPKVSQSINNVRLTPQFGNPLFQEMSAGCSDAPDIKHSASPSSEATGSDCKHFCQGPVFSSLFN